MGAGTQTIWSLSPSPSVVLATRNYTTSYTEMVGPIGEGTEGYGSPKGLPHRGFASKDCFSAWKSGPDSHSRIVVLTGQLEGAGLGMTFIDVMVTG